MLWTTGEIYRQTMKHKEKYRDNEKEACRSIIRIPVAKTLQIEERKLPITRSCFHYLADIEPLSERVPMQCIQVDSRSHCYLVGESFVPTHNSELAAAVALLLCCGDGEERAEVYGCAADRQQASIVFEVAADMVRMCPALSKRVKILASQKRMVYLPTNSFYQVLSAEAYSKHGFNIHGVVFDELHTQPNRKLFDVMTKGSGDARMQPLYFLITTAGTHSPSATRRTRKRRIFWKGERLIRLSTLSSMERRRMRTGQTRRSGNGQIRPSASRSVSTRYRQLVTLHGRIQPRRTASDSCG